MARTWMLALVVVLGGLVAAGCGGDDDDGGGSATPGGGGSGGDAAEYIAAATESMSEDDSSFVEDTARCVATSIVDLVGVDALHEAGVSPREFAESDSFAELDVELPDGAHDRLSESLSDCNVTGSLAAAVDLPPEAASCMQDNVDRQAVTDGLATVLLDESAPDDRLERPIMEALAGCPDALATLVLTQLGDDLPSEAAACVADFVGSHAELTSDALVGDDTETQQDFSTQLRAACPDAARG